MINYSIALRSEGAVLMKQNIKYITIPIFVEVSSIIFNLKDTECIHHIILVCVHECFICKQVFIKC